MQTKNRVKRGRVIPFERDVDFFLRRGSLRLERNDLLEAISNYYIAKEREPDNIEIHLAIAEVLTEMHRYEQSNSLLFPLLSSKQSPPECFFGIACNFLGMQEFGHAHDSLESYLTLEPDGEFVADALDMLDVIEDEELLYSMPGVHQKDERDAYSACARGRAMLEGGRVDEAIALLEKTTQEYPLLHFARNNLALACFLAKDFKRAMEIVNSVLEDAPGDVQAHCNLLLFLHAARNETGVEAALNFLRNSDTQDPQDWNRMAVVFMEMGRMDEALPILRKLQNIFPYDESTLHRLGVCYYHLGNYRAATDCYDRLIKVNPYDTVAAYYRKVAFRALKERPETIDWMYNYQVPYQELLRRVREINEINRLSRGELIKRWYSDKEFRALILWSLHLPDTATKRAMLQLIASFGGQEAELMLRRFQLDQMQPDAVKQEVFALLKRMEAREPYIAYLNGSLVQSRVQLQRTDRLGQRLPVAYQRALEICIRSMQEDRTNKSLMTAVELFQRYVGAQAQLPKLRGLQVYAFAAALHYLACRQSDEKATKAQVAGIYGISLVRLNNALNKIALALSGERDD